MLENSNAMALRRQYRRIPLDRCYHFGSLPGMRFINQNITDFYILNQSV